MQENSLPIETLPVSWAMSPQSFFPGPTLIDKTFLGNSRIHGNRADGMIYGREREKTSIRHSMSDVKIHGLALWSHSDDGGPHRCMPAGKKLFLDNSRP